MQHAFFFQIPVRLKKILRIAYKIPLTLMNSYHTRIITIFWSIIVLVAKWYIQAFHVS